MLGTVEGTINSDVIDTGYAGDPEGETVSTAGDVVLALEGNDTAFGGDGNDIISGGQDDDRLYGGLGDDTLKGDEGQDILWGDEGNDSLDGGAGDDTVKGGDGADVLTGGTGIDHLFGGADKDTIVGSTPGDVVDGGADGEDLDVLVLTGLPPYIITDLTPDSNGNGFNGTVVFVDGNGNPTGESFTFTEIEKIIEDDPREPDGTVEGTSGDDLIDTAYTGDPDGDMVDANDAILPGDTGNDDLILGFAGNDVILAGDGNDEVYGGADNDEIIGGGGTDTLYGDEGNDTLRDANGDNTYYGGAGDDTIVGGGTSGNNSMSGGTGNDLINGGEGNDTIDSSDGGVGLFDNPYPPLPADPFPNDDRDTVLGWGGDDTIRTGDDADSIVGGSGNDYIDAGIDDDTVRGDSGNDTIIGGEGNDNIQGNGGNDLIYGGLSPVFPDSLNIPDDAGDLVPDNGLDVINAGDGDDTVYGMDDDDSITGGGGNDLLDGGIDDDTVRGAQGNDTVLGGQGNDSLYGDTGNDVLTGGDGNDAIYGGNDRDVILGGNGGDVVDGGSGGDDFDVLDLTGAPVDFITYTSADREDGVVTFLDGSTLTFTEIENVVPCFTPGTAIATPRGERLVEDLQVGDRIITRDNGIQEIRWVGTKQVSGKQLVGSPHLKPVMIKAGALGNGLPERDMLLSPNHRVLVANDRTQLYFEESEVLASAKHLVGAPGVYELDVMATTYIHFMFDRHEVVLSNGAWTESFQPGDYSLKGLGNAQRHELLELFPELKTEAGLEGYQSARKALKKHEARLLVK